MGRACNRCRHGDDDKALRVFEFFGPVGGSVKAAFSRPAPESHVTVNASSRATGKENESE
jgi:hypothetical protein